MDLRQHHETKDGSRPAPRHFPAESAKTLGLAAMAVIERGDAFDARRAPPPDGPAQAAAWFDACVTLNRNGQPAATATRVRDDAIRLLAHAPVLVQRLHLARPLIIELVPQGISYRSFSFPRSALESAAGLFWDDPRWEHSRIGLRVEYLATLPALAAHELAHFLHCVAFTEEERTHIDRLLRPTFGNRANMDEAFAIYSEQEFLLADRFAPVGKKLPSLAPVTSQFSDRDKRGPGVYGFTRTQWDDNHVFTRFVRKLFHPHAPLAGQAVTGGGRQWKSFLGG